MFSALSCEENVEYLSFVATEAIITVAPEIVHAEATH